VTGHGVDMNCPSIFFEEGMRKGLKINEEIKSRIKIDAGFL